MSDYESTLEIGLQKGGGLNVHISNQQIPAIFDAQTLSEKERNGTTIYNEAEKRMSREFAVTHLSIVVH